MKKNVRDAFFATGAVSLDVTETGGLRDGRAGEGDSCGKWKLTRFEVDPVACGGDSGLSPPSGDRCTKSSIHPRSCSVLRRFTTVGLEVSPGDNNVEDGLPKSPIDSLPIDGLEARGFGGLSGLVGERSGTLIWTVRCCERSADRARLLRLVGGGPSRSKCLPSCRLSSFLLASLEGLAARA